MRRSTSISPALERRRPLTGDRNNGLLNVQYYDRIREILATDFSGRGVFNSRRFTKPILKHKKGGEHKDRGSLEYWDERVVEDLAVVEAAEDKHLEGT